MTGRILTGPRHDLQVTRRVPGHIRALFWGMVLAGLAVVVLGL